MYEVQVKAEGFFDPLAKTDSRFIGTLDECKSFLKDVKDDLEEKGVFYGVLTDDVTLEIMREEDDEPTLEKYMIVNLL